MDSLAVNYLGLLVDVLMQRLRDDGELFHEGRVVACESNPPVHLLRSGRKGRIPYRRYLPWVWPSAGCGDHVPEEGGLPAADGTLGGVECHTCTSNAVEDDGAVGEVRLPR